MKFIVKENPPQCLVEIDYSVESSLKSFKEEALEELYSIHKKHSVERLLLSDGMDSRFLALLLLELGIKIKPLSFVFKNEPTAVSEEIDRFCKEQGLKPEYFYMDEDELFKHINVLTYEKKVAYPVLNGYYHDYVLTNIKEKFFNGMPNEFRYQNNYYIELGRVSPMLVEKNFPNTIFGYASSRVFLAYINHKIFKSLFKTDRHLLPRKDEFYLRDLIYMDVYPNLTLREKSSWFDEHMMLRWTQMYDDIKRNVPWVFELKLYKFLVPEYFKKKGLYD